MVRKDLFVNSFENCVEKDILTGITNDPSHQNITYNNNFLFVGEKNPAKNNNMLNIGLINNQLLTFPPISKEFYCVNLSKTGTSLIFGKGYYKAYGAF